VDYAGQHRVPRAGPEVRVLIQATPRYVRIYTIMPEEIIYSCALVIGILAGWDLARYPITQSLFEKAKRLIIKD